MGLFYFRAFRYKAAGFTLQAFEYKRLFTAIPDANTPNKKCFPVSRKAFINSIKYNLLFYFNYFKAFVIA
jgi:hypothetical protein